MNKNKTTRKTHCVEIEFSDENVTSFAGLILVHRLASRLGLWSTLEKALPPRKGQYSWMEVIQAGIAGLFSGSRGSFATEEVRKDEATFWCSSALPLAVWWLYDAKGKMELGYKELLSDLNLHHPPCQEHKRNAGFFALATLAHTLAMGVKLTGLKSDRASRRRDGCTPPGTQL